MVQLKCGYRIREGVAVSKCIQTSAENDQLLDVPLTNTFGEFRFGQSTPGGDEESKAFLLRLFLSRLEQFLGSESRDRYRQRILEDGSPLYELMSSPVRCRNESSSARLARQQKASLCTADRPLRFTRLSRSLSGVHVSFPPELAMAAFIPAISYGRFGVLAAVKKFFESA
jgi:hypothetical protein